MTGAQLYDVVIMYVKEWTDTVNRSISQFSEPTQGSLPGPVHPI